MTESTRHDDNQRVTVSVAAIAGAGFQAPGTDNILVSVRKR